MSDTANRELPSSLETELAKPLIVSKFDAPTTPRHGPPTPIISTWKEIVYETHKKDLILPKMMMMTSRRRRGHRQEEKKKMSEP